MAFLSASGSSRLQRPEHEVPQETAQPLHAQLLHVQGDEVPRQHQVAQLDLGEGEKRGHERERDVGGEVRDGHVEPQRQAHAEHEKEVQAVEGRRADREPDRDAERSPQRGQLAAAKARPRLGEPRPPLLPGHPRLAWPPIPVPVPFPS
jgi:hypothetical protein